MNLINSELGKKSNYQDQYDSTLLFPIPRSLKRNEIGIDDSNLPFYGVDIWNHYEISWLNPKGKPVVAVGTIIYPCTSPNIIESKSMKLYFNSFNNTKFEDANQVVKTVIKDISHAVGAEVNFDITLLNDSMNTTNDNCNYSQASNNIKTINSHFKGVCLDDLDITCDIYLPNPNYLNNQDISNTSTNSAINHNINNNTQSINSSTKVHEILYSNLLKSNCLVTNQPDWGSVYIEYTGTPINHEGLLKYIVSLRNHNEFHEQCVERIFNDILNICCPLELTVYALYTRRGGLDINPYRSTKKNHTDIINYRLIRQ